MIVGSYSLLGYMMSRYGTVGPDQVLIEIKQILPGIDIFQEIKYLQAYYPKTDFEIVMTHCYDSPAQLPVG